VRAACFFLAAALVIAQDQNGGIAGVVTDAITHQPVKRATVSALPSGAMTSNAGLGQRSTAPQAATTDAAGVFAISGLPPGKYRLSVTHRSYPQTPGNRAGQQTIEVMAGVIKGPVTVELMPGASVTGHILDEDGDPLTGCMVSLRNFSNPNQYAGQTQSPSQEDGEYRVYGVASGKYTISAQCSGTVFQPRPLSSGPDPPPSLAYPVQFYPADAAHADAVELTAGSEKAAVDFQMRPSAVTQVRGTFSPSGADWRGSPSMSLELRPAVQSGPAAVEPNQRFARIDQASGTFEFRSVFPGSYVLTASSNGEDPASRIIAFTRVEVADRPAAAVLELRHAIDVNGTVEIENNSNSAVSSPNLQIRLVSQYSPGGSTAVAKVNDDGSFTIKSALPTPSLLRVNGPNLFVKSAWMGTTDVTNALVDLSSGMAGPLRIVLSTNTATIRGTAPAGQTVGAQFADDRGGVFNRFSNVDQSGQFTIKGLAPGKYRLFAADSPGPIPEQGGQEVTVGEGETAMIELKASQ
jgi:hypothetical protein